MNFHRTILFTLPLLLSSSLALAQQTPCPDAGATSTKTTKTTKTKKPAETKSKTTDTTKQGAASGSTTVGGTKIENKDTDLDMSVSQTTTTAAEQPPRRDVVESRAEEVREGEGKRWSVAPLLGYGTGRLNFGMGARAGYTFETPIYVGATFLYHFGDSNVVNAPGVSDSRRSYYYPAAEVGYDIGIGPVLVRPYAGAGILFNRTTATTNGNFDSNTKSEFMIYPGVAAQYILPKTPVFVGADARAVLPLEGEAASFSMFATAGLTM